MKKTISTKIFAILAMFMLCALNICADGTLITQQITVTVESPGNLQNQIGNTKAQQITNLKLIGDINSTDINYIRWMAGRYYDDKSSANPLQYLDLSEANIVKGGIQYYMNTYAVCYYTENDIVGYRMFMNCTLKSIKLPKSTKIIAEDAFRGCKSLEEITIPEGVEQILSNAFYESALTNVYIPNSVKTLGGCFISCKSLKEVHLPEGLTSVPYECFKFCDKLEKVNMPNTLEKIESYAFGYCNSLTSISIPSSVKEIEHYAFVDCKGLTAVNITDFDAWQRIIFGEEVNNKKDDKQNSNPVFYAKHLYLNGKEIENINVPYDITAISPNAYCCITSAKKAEIHSNVTSVGTNAFYGCTGLKEIRVHAQKPPKATKSTFEQVDKQECTLYVPRGTYTDYFLAEGWGDFLNIVEFEATGIETIEKSEPTETYFDTVGNKSDKPFKGLNIVKKENGETYKTIKQ